MIEGRCIHSQYWKLYFISYDDTCKNDDGDYDKDVDDDEDDDVCHDDFDDVSLIV